MAVGLRRLGSETLDAWLLDHDITRSCYTLVINIFNIILKMYFLKKNYKVAITYNKSIKMGKLKK